MMQEARLPSLCEVIILTALPVEWHAVLAYLQEPQEIVHPSGTIYHQGSFVGTQHAWRVAMAEIGMGGLSAATETERAITFFRPRVVLFVGIAGGLKDVRRGDVVAATKVYAYEAGKALEQFRPRPEVWRASHALEQRARAEAHHDGWLTRLNNSPPDPAPQVFVGALAAGEKVVASKASNVHRLLQTSYSDALAIEMEGHGFLQAVHANHLVHGLVIRGISDLVDDKVAADRAGAQEVAAQHAAAFAFQVLATFTFPKEEQPSPHAATLQQDPVSPSPSTPSPAAAVAL
jgi:nucleoside phosphorylase